MSSSVTDPLASLTQSSLHACLEVLDVSIDIAGKAASQPLIKRLSLTVQQGEIACLLGVSGCGKTTLLRAIAGFQTIQSGQIRLEGQTVATPTDNLPPEQRRVGLVFQEYALFPHLTVFDNIAFGLRAWRREHRSARISAMLSLVGLSAHQKKYPHELSGGQQQRVALARALAPQPALLLLDEPFSNLDVTLRERLSLEVRDILKDAETTAIFVTHDQLEAFALADSVGVLHAGRIAQWDTPYNLYHQPSTRFVAEFVGQGVFVPGSLECTELGQRVHLELGVCDLPHAADCVETSLHARPQPVDVLLRPDDVRHDDASQIQAEVVRKIFRGADFLYTLRLASGDLVLANVPSHHDHAVGQKIGIFLELGHVITFPQSIPANSTHSKLKQE
ncbi:MAG: ABC transporter ATP-binding protein [Pseudomonadota bacterium]